tara:strand:- start:389 stop:496 length:108 start_codon:yes stop_codon:yes gene_type:complete
MVMGWFLFAILIFVNSAIYIGINMAFDNDFWEEDD